MNLSTAASMLDKLNRQLSKNPSPDAIVSMVRDFIVPILEEIVARGAETNAAVEEVEDLARTAFITSRQTLSGEIFSNISQALVSLREQLETSLAEDHPALQIVDQIEDQVSVYMSYLFDEEGSEAEEETVEEPAPAVTPEEPPVVEAPAGAAEAVPAPAVTAEGPKPTESPAEPS